MDARDFINVKLCCENWSYLKNLPEWRNVKQVFSRTTKISWITPKLYCIFITRPYIFTFFLDQLEWLMIRACRSLSALFTGVTLRGLSLWKNCVWCLCMYHMFCVCVWTGFVDWFEKRFIYETSFEMWFCLWWSLIVLSWPTVVDRMLKSN